MNLNNPFSFIDHNSYQNMTTSSSSSSSSSSSCSMFLPRNMQSWMVVLVPSASLFFAMVSAPILSISITSLALLISTAIMALKHPKPISKKNQNQGEISSEIKKVAEEGEEQQISYHDPSSSSEDYSDIDSIVRCSDDDDGSISDDDEESLFEICLLPYCSGHEKESSKDLCLQKHCLLEFLTDMNEEDNMIEIDISMGSIKCSGFEY